MKTPHNEKTIDLLALASQDKTDRQLCALAYTAWACCAIGNVPDNFGEGMVLIGKKLGIPPTQDNLATYCQERGW